MSVEVYDPSGLVCSIDVLREDESCVIVEVEASRRVKVLGYGGTEVYLRSADDQGETARLDFRGFRFGPVYVFSEDRRDSVMACFFSRDLVLNSREVWKAADS